MLIIQNFIRGEFQTKKAANYLEVYEPALGQLIAQVPDSDESDAALALDAAEAAFPQWSRMPAEERSKLLLNLAQLLEDNLEEFAQWESRDTGKPLKLAQGLDIPRAAKNLRFFATAATHFASESHPSPGVLNYTLRTPLGVVACISPWNLPLYLLTWKIAPALAAGNCVIAKPSEITPITAFKLGALVQKAGFPPGVLNILHGQGPKIGAYLCQSPRIKAISFTGSTQSGREIAQRAAQDLKKVSLELGGKNPVLIFEDCDYESMLNTTLRSSFANQGQICLCGSRILVEKSLYPRFKQDFLERTQKLKVGDPQSPENDLGAVISKAHQKKILDYLQLAREEGGIFLCGGGIPKLPAPFSQGYYISPSIIEGLSLEARCNQEEIFGPVVSIGSFEDEEEALKIANGVRYGLAATLWTQNTRRALRVSEELEAGIVWVNSWMERDLRTPFGGYKESGLGREGGWEALRFFTNTKNVSLKY